MKEKKRGREKPCRKKAGLDGHCHYSNFDLIFFLQTPPKGRGGKLWKRAWCYYCRNLHSLAHDREAGREKKTKRMGEREGKKKTGSRSDHRRSPWALIWGEEKKIGKEGGCSSQRSRRLVPLLCTKRFSLGKQEEEKGKKKKKGRIRNREKGRPEIVRFVMCISGRI